MNEHRVIPVERNDPLVTAHAVLQAIWTAAGLERMLIPVWSEDLLMPAPLLIDRPAALVRADPFAPIMPANSAGAAADAIRSSRGRRLGLFLRPCEIRSLRKIADREGLDLKHVFLFSSDCLGAIPNDDYRRHLTLTKDHLQMTRETLQFAAQGGVLPSRYQQSCQLCDAPYPTAVDLHFELFGSETQEHLLLNWDEQRLSSSLHEHLELAEAPDLLLERRQRVINNLSRWRSRSLEHQRGDLDPSLATPEALLAHIEHCSVCWDTLETHCPTFDGTLVLAPDGGSALLDWLSSCGGCGMCASKCPDGFPLFEIIVALRSLDPDLAKRAHKPL
jgi:Pyruvate/2-oxoacid:ferredoxin oxidoreductase delta subunit